MADEDIVLRYRADVTQLRTDINNIIALNEKLAQSVKDASIASKQSANDQKQAASVSKKSIETQINQQNRLKNAIKETGTEAKKSASGFKTVNREVKNTGKELKKVNKEGGVFSNTVKRIGAGIAIAFSVQQVKQFLDQTVKVAKEFDSIRRSLDFIEDGAIGGSETFGFLTDLAEEYGLELRSTVEAYRQFSGAARLAGLSSQETQSIFRDTSKAITALGLGAQQADRIFLALSQIVSKGVVSAEELRRQLGDALPGAFSIAAKSAGLTEAEFNKLLSTGQILSKDFLPNFAKLLGSTFEEGAVEGAKSLNAELNRLQNELTEVQIAVGQKWTPVWISFKKFGLDAFDAILTRAGLLAKAGEALVEGDFAKVEKIFDSIIAGAGDLTKQLQALNDERFGQQALDLSIKSIKQQLEDAENTIQKQQLASLKKQEQNLALSYGRREITIDEFNEKVKKVQEERNKVSQRNAERQLQAVEQLTLAIQSRIENILSKPLPESFVFSGETIKSGERLLELLQQAEKDKEKLLETVPVGFRPEDAFDQGGLKEFNNELNKLNNRIELFGEKFQSSGFRNINLIKGLQAQLEFLGKTAESLDQEIFPPEVTANIEKATLAVLDYEDLLKKSLLEVARIRDEQSKIFRESADEDVKKAAKANLETAERAFKTLEKLYDDARERRQEAIDDFRKGTEDLSVIFTSQLREALEEGVDSVDIYERLASKLVEDLEQAKRLIDAQVPAIVNARIQNELPIEGETGPLPFDPQRALEIEDEVKADAEKLKIIEDENFYKRIEALRQFLEERGFLIQEAGDAEVEGWFLRNEEILRSVGDLYSQIAALSGALTDRRIQELDRELKAVRDAANEEEENLRQQRENRLITEEFFQNELARIKEKEKETEEKVNKEKNKLARKQAILDKSAAIYDITLNTAVAISENLTKPFLIALIAALGAAQIATVVATPIPQFARGTKGKKDSGMAIVGEEGPEMTFLDRGTKVLPAKQTKQYSNVFDAMYDNRFDDYVLKEYVSPALEAQKKQYESQRQETFAQNIVNSMTGLTYYDLEASRKKGQYINNIDEFAKAVAKASEINYRRL